MKYCLITFRSITYAQRGEEILRKKGIPCRLFRTPKNLSERGCGYCLRIREDELQNAAKLLEEAQLAYTAAYLVRENGSAEEWVP